MAKKGKCHKNTIASFCAGDGAELAELHRNAIFVSNGCFACADVVVARARFPGIAVCVRVSVSVSVCLCVCRLLNFDELTAIINLLTSKSLYAG